MKYTCYDSKYRITWRYDLDTGWNYKLQKHVSVLNIIHFWKTIRIFETIHSYSIIEISRIFAKMINYKGLLPPGRA